MNEVERSCAKEKWAGRGATSNSKLGTYSLEFNLSRKLKNEKDRLQGARDTIPGRRNTTNRGPKAWSAFSE